MRIVVAIGGNALLRRGEKPESNIQLHHIKNAAVALAPLAAEHDLLICHGNGPQVGLLALESETDLSLERPYPLDVLGTQTQGMIGYWLAQCLRNAGVVRPVVTVVTQTVVNADDPAFLQPTKFVGSVYTDQRAHDLAGRLGWTVARDGEAWRRVVPSPLPRRIVEQRSIDGLLDAHAVVICGGGGGAPVTEDTSGRLTGVEGVVDKDFTAALLAVETGADRLLVLTDVSGVVRDFGTPHAVPLRTLSVSGAAGLDLPTGSMGPKVEACRRFVAATGRPAAIGSLLDGEALLAGTVGTTIVADETACRPPPGAR